MNKHEKKMIAPIVITVLTILYFIWFAYLVIDTEPSAALCVFGTAVLLLLAGVMLAVLLERLKEIRSGEEDDLSKY